MFFPFFHFGAHDDNYHNDYTNDFINNHHEHLLDDGTLDGTICMIGGHQYLQIGNHFYQIEGNVY